MFTDVSIHAYVYLTYDWICIVHTHTTAHTYCVYSVLGYVVTKFVTYVHM